MSDHINDVLERIGDRYVEEAACYRAASVGQRRMVRLAVIAACAAVFMTVGVTGWERLIRPQIESDGLRRYSYHLVDHIPENAPQTVEQVFLPDVSLLESDHELAYCLQTKTDAGSYIATVYRGTRGNQFAVTQFPFVAFDHYANKRASVTYMPDEIRRMELAGREVLCEIIDGGITDVIWSDGVYCFELHNSNPLTESQWSMLLNSFREEPGYEELAMAHPYYYPDSGTLETVLIPDFLPDGLGTFSWEISPYCAEWNLYDEEGYGVLFQQTPLDVRNYHTEDHTKGPYYGGEIKEWFLINGVVIYEGESGGFWDYLWYEGGDRCLLRFDKETNLDFRPLAQEIIAHMTRVTPEEAENFYICTE